MTDTRPRIAILDEDDDDRPVGRVLTRREFLALFGTAGAAVIIAACTPAAVEHRLAPREQRTVCLPIFGGCRVGECLTDGRGGLNGLNDVGGLGGCDGLRRGVRLARHPRLCRCSGPDRGPLLRRREAQSVRHSHRPVRREWLRQAPRSR